jgi:hypothetical protein
MQAELGELKQERTANSGCSPLACSPCKGTSLMADATPLLKSRADCLCPKARSSWNRKDFVAVGGWLVF